MLIYLVFAAAAVALFIGVGLFIEWSDKKSFPDGFPGGSMWG